MLQNIDAQALPWSDYELLDSGNNQKLERFGSFVVARPEPQAIWMPRYPEIWKQANAIFKWNEAKGAWHKNNCPAEWNMAWNEIKFNLRLTGFKHLGVFPEQAANWDWLVQRLSYLKSIGLSQPRVLNLFGYTGIASMVAAQNGAGVIHVDASKQSNEWSRFNAKLSMLPETSIHYLLEDALKFVDREAKRGNFYDGIILDPPAFGRGPKKEIWKIEESLPVLLDKISRILSPKSGSFFLLNGYAAGYAPSSFLQLVSDFFPEIAEEKIEGSFGYLVLNEARGKWNEFDLKTKPARKIAEGIYTRFHKI